MDPRGLAYLPRPRSIISAGPGPVGWGSRVKEIMKYYNSIFVKRHLNP
jgi:hypothetical protein